MFTHSIQASAWLDGDGIAAPLVFCLSSNIYPVIKWLEDETRVITRGDVDRPVGYDRDQQRRCIIFAHSERLF